VSKITQKDFKALKNAEKEYWEWQEKLERMVNKNA